MNAKLQVIASPAWAQCCAALTERSVSWEEVALVFGALSDPNRLRIVGQLMGDAGVMGGGDEQGTGAVGQAVGDVAGCCSVDLSVVSRHLKQLKVAGLVTSERDGKQVRYRLRTDRIVPLLRGLADALEQCCPTEDGLAGDEVGENT